MGLVGWLAGGTPEPGSLFSGTLVGEPGAKLGCGFVGPGVGMPCPAPVEELSDVPGDVALPGLVLPGPEPVCATLTLALSASRRKAAVDAVLILLSSV